ncbi:MAG: hypothetical protein ABIH23_01480 [bacterium]
MKGILWIAAIALLGLLTSGCASTQTSANNPFPHESWYSDLEPFSKDRVTDWALFDLGYPTYPDFKDPADDPFYDLKQLFK